MNWIDIASIVFVCVTMNHLGLVSAIESAIHRKLWILDCPKCLTTWCTLAYLLSVGSFDIPMMFAISFLASYTAIWLELFEGFIDTLYNKVYEKIYTNTGYDTDSSDPDGDDSAGSVPEL